MLDDAGLPDGEHKPRLMAYLDRLVALIGDSPLDGALEARLNAEMGPESEAFTEMTRLLRLGIDEGWAGYEVIDGDNYRRGRLVNNTGGAHEFAVESARLKDVKGNYHTHTLGEINMIQPVDETATFCGAGRGWKVFAPGTSHYPTVRGGLCTFLFLLPKGLIEYHHDR